MDGSHFFRSMQPDAVSLSNVLWPEKLEPCEPMLGCADGDDRCYILLCHSISHYLRNSGGVPRICFQRIAPLYQTGNASDHRILKPRVGVIGVAVADVELTDATIGRSGITSQSELDKVCVSVKIGIGTI
jgi:hypothetical protein